MKRLIFLLLISALIYGQNSLDWTVLSELRVDYHKGSGKNKYVWKVRVGEKVLESIKKDIIISGYIIPVDLNRNTYALSRFPFTSCFFCGGGGMESIMELELSDPERQFSVDDFMKFKGRLVVNTKDQNRLAYILKHAEIIEE